MLLLVNVLILLTASTSVNAGGIMAGAYGNYHQATNSMGHFLGGFYNFLVAIWAKISPKRIVTNHSEGQKMQFQSDFETKVKPQISDSIVKFFSHTKTAQVLITPFHTTKLHLTEGTLKGMQNTMLGDVEYKDEGFGFFLEAKVPFTVTNAIVEYNYEFEKMMKTHKGKLTAMVPDVMFTATYSLGTEGRLWGLTNSKCFVHMNGFRYNGNGQGLVVPTQDIEVTGKLDHETFKDAVGQLIGKYVPFWMARAIDHALRSKAVAFYYCW